MSLALDVLESKVGMCFTKSPKSMKRKLCHMEETGMRSVKQEPWPKRLKPCIVKPANAHTNWVKQEPLDWFSNLKCEDLDIYSTCNVKMDPVWALKEEAMIDSCMFDPDTLPKLEPGVDDETVVDFSPPPLPPSMMDEPLPSELMNVLHMNGYELGPTVLVPAPLICPPSTETDTNDMSDMSDQSLTWSNSDAELNSIVLPVPATNTHFVKLPSAQAGSELPHSFQHNSSRYSLQLALKASNGQLVSRPNFRLFVECVVHYRHGCKRYDQVPLQAFLLDVNVSSAKRLYQSNTRKMVDSFILNIVNDSKTRVAQLVWSPVQAKKTKGVGRSRPKNTMAFNPQLETPNMCLRKTHCNIQKKAPSRTQARRAKWQSTYSVKIVQWTDVLPVLVDSECNEIRFFDSR